MKKILKIIDEIIPFDLFLLINFPLLLGCFIDFALIDFRYLLINIVWITVFSVPSILLKSSIPHKIATVIFFAIGFTEIIHWILIKGPVTVASILTLGGTHFDESFDFLLVCCFKRSHDFCHASIAWP